MDDILFGYLCEVDHVEELEDGIHHRVWVHTLCPRKKHHGLYVRTDQFQFQTGL